MNVLMVRAKVKEENVADARAAIEKVIQALEQAQPAGVRYASCLLKRLDDLFSGCLGVGDVFFLDLGAHHQHVH